MSFLVSKMDKISNRTLLQRNKIEGQWGLTEEYIACSNRIVENNGTLEEYYAKIDKIFSK